MSVLVDTNVLIDVAVRDPQWLAWSRAKLIALWRDTVLQLNPTIKSVEVLILQCFLCWSHIATLPCSWTMS